MIKPEEESKMKRSWIFALAIVTLLGAAGCSSVQKVVALQGDAAQPYESLGTLEVKRDVPAVQYKRIFSQLGAWMTFGHSEPMTQAVYLRGLLDAKLIKLAKKKHCADAIIRVQYWPDLTAGEFPDGVVYARGEMIRYKRFPE